ncbi:MAG: nucleotidyltransferase substrate binding protein [Deltaproteobacteria bacterium]|nr:nucleotidyltransferase substrate binding protein [Deltaproteobacteria bacterium]
MPLDLSSLRKGISSLRTAIEVADAEKMSVFDRATQDVIRAGVIQNFEFTYELCWKFIQRWLKENHPGEDADLPRARRELFRMAARYGLIDDPAPWFVYSDARNMTAHVYDERRAQIVYDVALKFINEAETLLKCLEDNND